MENPSLWVLAFAQGTLYETTQNDTDYLGITWYYLFFFSNFWIPNHGLSAKRLFFLHPSLRAGVGGLDGVSRQLQPWQIEKELDETFSDRRLLVEAEAGFPHKAAALKRV